MNRRDDEAFLLGLMRNPRAFSGHPILEQMSSDAITIREKSTLLGLLRQWPQCERRRISGPWDGVERREWRKAHA